MKPVRLTGYGWSVIRRVVLARDGECCVYCGNLIDPAGHWECHHRRLRSQQGGDVVENLIALHKTCHERVHREVTEWSYAFGFLVPGVLEPSLWRVQYHQATWMQPGDAWVMADPEEFQQSRVDAWRLKHPTATPAVASDPWGAWDL